MASILIVDDNEGIRESLSAYFYDLGHEPTMVASIADALHEMLARQQGYRYRNAPLPLELRRVTMEAATQVYEPASLGAAIDGLLRTPPQVDTSHLNRVTVSLERRLEHLRDLLTSRRSFSSRLRMLASSTRLPTWRTRPPTIDSSTSLVSSIVFPVLRSISAPTDSITDGSSSIALVRVTSSRWFASSQSSSKRLRIPNSAGIRCFSASSSRKLTSSGFAPEIVFAIPSRFSAEEK